MPVSDGRVPTDRPVVSTSPILIGRPVLAQTALDHALLAHWISGRGQVVVPQHRVAMIVDGTTETLRFYAPGSGRATDRCWCLDLRSMSGATEGVDSGAEGSVTIGGVTSYWYTYRTTGPQVLWFFETGITPSSSEGELTIDVTSDTSKGLAAVRIESIACWELPRAALDRTAADCGVALDSLFPRRPLIDDETSPRETSLAAVYEASHRMTVSDPLRRIGHISRWGYEMEIGSTTGASTTVAPYRLVPRKIGVTDTTKTVRCRMYGYETGGSGKFRVTVGSSGPSAWTALPTSYGWSSSVDVSVNCEDPTTVDGQPGGGYDTLKFEVKFDGGGGGGGGSGSGSGSGTVYVKGWSAYEYT